MDECLLMAKGEATVGLLAISISKSSFSTSNKTIFGLSSEILQSIMNLFVF
jgi:hypothetical protein